MLKLSAPVGKITGNKHNEVKVVQQLLNHHLECLAGYAPLIENGLADQNTVDAIRTFQIMAGISVVEIYHLTQRTHVENAQPACDPHFKSFPACQLIDQAQIRDAIVKRLNIVERSDWHALTPDKIPQHDWDYHSIAIHHAGNSFSCDIEGR